MRSEAPAGTVSAMPLFDGATFEPKKDEARLAGELAKVFELMRDGKSRTLAEIVAAIGCGSEAGVSARLRDLRKHRFGGWDVRRERRGDPKEGIFEYWIAGKKRAE